MTIDEAIAAESKDALLEWALQSYGVKLNGAYRYETLVEKARELAAAHAGFNRPEQAPLFEDRPEAERWLLNPKTGNRFPWTAMLAARGDLVPCEPPEPDEAAPS